MNICLQNRTEDTVIIYFHKTKDAKIQKVLPQKAQTLSEAIDDYRKTLHKDSKSYGKTIYVDGNYVGDIWCFGIHVDDNPDAMISYCIFEKEYWNHGVATEALKLFLNEIVNRFELSNIGAFTYSSNIASIKVLENNGFREIETFIEAGMESKYFLYHK